MTDRHDEHYESIPWDSLVTDDARRRRRWLYLGVGLVVALALGAAIGQLLGNGGGVTSTIAGSDTSSPPTSVASSTTSTEVRVDTAADSDTAQAARSHAEWFVADYFTVDGSELTRQSVIDRLPAGLEMPEVEGDGRSFVESVFTTEVESLGSDRFRVVMVVRALAAPDGVGYQRQPPRAVEVIVEVTEEGPAVVDLPRPRSIDVAVVPTPELSDDDPPDRVLEAAVAEAALWGEPIGEPLIGRAGDVWRVVHTVQDDEGLRWPVASWLDDDGRPVLPPGTGE